MNNSMKVIEIADRFIKTHSMNQDDIEFMKTHVSYGEHYARFYRCSFFGRLYFGNVVFDMNTGEISKKGAGYVITDFDGKTYRG